MTAHWRAFIPTGRHTHTHTHTHLSPFPPKARSFGLSKGQLCCCHTDAGHSLLVTEDLGASSCRRAHVRLLTHKATHMNERGGSMQWASLNLTVHHYLLPHAIARQHQRVEPPDGCAQSGRNTSQTKKQTSISKNRTKLAIPTAAANKSIRRLRRANFGVCMN